MANYNKVMLMGNITRDIELRYTPKGTAVADVTIASNRVRSGDDGQRIEDVTFVDVTMWGRQAELANQYLGKGRPVFIEGRLAMDSWVDQQTGKNRTKLKVVCENFQFIGGNQGGGQAQAGGAPQQQRQASPQPPVRQQQAAPPAQQQPPQGGSATTSTGPQFVDEEDDIPF